MAKDKMELKLNFPLSTLEIFRSIILKLKTILVQNWTVLREETECSYFLANRIIGFAFCCIILQI